MAKLTTKEKNIVEMYVRYFGKTPSVDEISKYNFETEEIDDINDLRQICHEYEKYLYYCDVNGKNYIMTHQGIPSQFLRMFLANSLQKQEWNWR